MNKTKYLLPLTILLALSSCGKTTIPSTSPSTGSSTGSSSSTPSSGTSKPGSESQKPSVEEEKTVEDYFDDFLLKVQFGYQLNGKIFYYTSDGYSNYYVDLKVKKDGYEFKRFESAQNEDPSRDEVYISYYYTYDQTALIPYVSEPVLDISNQVDYSPAPIGDNGTYVTWNSSSYVNLLSKLRFEDFTSIDDRTFLLKNDAAGMDGFLNRFAEQIYPKNPGRTIKSLAFVFDRKTKGFTLDLTFNPFGGFSKNEMEYTAEVIPGDFFDFENEVKTYQGSEKEALEEAFGKLRKYHYSFTDIIQKPNDEQSALVVESSFSGKTDGKNLIIASTGEEMTTDFLYQSTDDNTIQQAIHLKDSYYAYHDPVKAKITALLPTFDISTVFFDYDSSKGVYVYNRKAAFTKSQTYNMSGEGMAVSEMEIKTDKTKVTFNINFNYPQRTEEIVYTFLDDNLSILDDITIKDDCSELLMSDLLKTYPKTLNMLITKVGGKDNLNLIPTLGGKESVAGLYLSDGVDSEGEETKEKYFGIEYRLVKNTGYSQILAFEKKLVKNGFILDKVNQGSHFNGDLYKKTIIVNGQEKTMALDVGYSSETLAIAIDVL